MSDRYFIRTFAIAIICCSAAVNADHKTASRTEFSVGQPAELFAGYIDHTAFPIEDGLEPSLLNYSGRIGYGSKSTGGFGGRECIVSSLADSGDGSLRSCVQNDYPAWIKFSVSGVINLNEYLFIGDNKTIDGRNSNITLSGENGVLCENSSNIIIHNVKIRNVGSGIRLSEGCRSVWLDHIDIENVADEGISITNGATDITVSWTSIKNTKKAILIGRHISDTRTRDTRVTLHHNLLAAGQRNPNVRYASVHMFNNLIQEYIYEGAVASQNSEIQSHRNFYSSHINSLHPSGLTAHIHNKNDNASGFISSFEDQFSSQSKPKGNVWLVTALEGIDIPYEYWPDEMNSDIIYSVSEFAGWIAPSN